MLTGKCSTSRPAVIPRYRGRTMVADQPSSAKRDRQHAEHVGKSARLRERYGFGPDEEHAAAAAHRRRF